jgi:hypothetical protein
LIETTPNIIQKAMALAKSHTLRGYDAVQLATALQANQDRISIGGAPLAFISADNHLNSAAAAEGLSVDNPNNHP